MASELAADAALIHVIAPAISDGAWFAVVSAELAEPPDAEIMQALAGLPGGEAPIQEDLVRFVPVASPVELIVDAARG